MLVSIVQQRASRNFQRGLMIELHMYIFTRYLQIETESRIIL